MGMDMVDANRPGWPVGRHSKHEALDRPGYGAEGAMQAPAVAPGSKSAAGRADPETTL